MRRLAVVTLALACNTNPDAAPDAALTDADSESAPATDAASDSATDSPSDAGSDAAPANGYDGGIVNKCTTFVDDTADGGLIVGPMTQPPAQYVPNCVHIVAGQSVTWTSNFADHPLMTFGGTTPTPIVTTSTGTTVTFTFPAPGTYGYQCQFHPFAMYGAVQVTP